MDWEKVEAFLRFEWGEGTTILFVEPEIWDAIRDRIDETNDLLGAVAERKSPVKELRYMGMRILHAYEKVSAPEDFKFHRRTN